jgi:hypothetical protein
MDAKDELGSTSHGSFSSGALGMTMTRLSFQGLPVMGSMIVFFGLAFAGWM